MDSVVAVKFDIRNRLRSKKSLTCVRHGIASLELLHAVLVDRMVQLTCASSDATCFLTPHFMLLMTKLAMLAWWPDDTSTPNLE